MTEFVYKPQVEILEKTADIVRLLLTIPENLYYFQGHFPQAAILPGVVQLDWVNHYLTEYFNIDVTELVSVDVLKFQTIVRPNYKIELKLARLNLSKYSFSYYSEHGQHASGKVVLS